MYLQSQLSYNYRQHKTLELVSNKPIKLIRISFRLERLNLRAQMGRLLLLQTILIAFTAYSVYRGSNKRTIHLRGTRALITENVNLYKTLVKIKYILAATCDFQECRTKSPQTTPPAHFCIRGHNPPPS